MRSCSSIKKAADQFAPHLALQAVWDFVAQANEYIEKTQPFKLAKDPAQAKRLDVNLALLAEVAPPTFRHPCASCAGLQRRKIRAQLQLPTHPVRLDEALFGNSLRGHTIGKPKVILFPPIEEKPPAA